MFLLYDSNERDTMFENDEHLLNTLKGLGLKRILALEERTIASFLTADLRHIRRRQEIFSDLEKKPELCDVLRRMREDLSNIREMSQKRAQLGRTAEDVLYSFGEVVLFITMIKEAGDALSQTSPESSALKELDSTLRDIANDPKFHEISAYVEDLSQRRQFARSMTLGVNLDASFGVKEVGVVAIHDDYYTVSNLFTSIFGSSGKKNSLVCMTPFAQGEKSQVMNHTVYNILNNYILHAFTNARAVLLRYISSVISVFYPLVDELDFILRVHGFCSEIREKKGKLCMPEFQKHRLFLKNCWEPSLLHKMNMGSIVKNDMEADETTSILLLTGPNNGGKSVYLKSIGIAAVMAQLGMPICANRAELPLFTRILCHFPAADSPDESRLVAECRSMRAILDVLDGKSLLLMDESFSGTASVEGAVIAGEVLKTVRSRTALCVFSTHMHELAAKSSVEEFNRGTPKMKTLSAEYQDGRRTYRIVEQPDSGFSRAYEIAAQFGLQFKENREI